MLIQRTIYQIEARKTTIVMIFEPLSSNVSLQSYKRKCNIIHKTRAFMAHPHSSPCLSRRFTMMHALFLEYIYCKHTHRHHINMAYMFDVSYVGRGLGSPMLNIMVCGHAQFAVKKLFFLTFCCSASGHL
jgi:hypothetical protein